MIKNEQKTICRLLESCKGIATHYVIVDTGSTDDTKKVATDWLKSNNCLFSIYDIPFEDFGTSRTKTIRSGQEFIQTYSLIPKDSYLLLLDADMILVNNGFRQQDLKYDVILLVQQSGALEYKNVRLVRSNLKMQYIGRTHEYIDISGDHKKCNYYGLRINDIGDGGCKSDKFLRDLKLLKEDLKENPKNERSLYYLASTYESLGDVKNSIETYSARIDAGGWDEEVWMSRYRRGIIRLYDKQVSLAEDDFIKCWMTRPWRTEPLFHLAQLYLNTNKQTHACNIAKAALNIGFPDNDTLFIESNCYHDEFYKILSIGDFYAGRKFDGAGHSDNLILRKGAWFRDNALQNASWYMPKLPVKNTINLSQLFPLKEGWYACNPSIIKTSKYHLSIRTVNYKIRNDGSYDYPGVVSTETYHAILDDKLQNLIKYTQLQNPKDIRQGSNIIGIEDVRLYQVDNNDSVVEAIGTRCDSIEATPQIYRCSWTNGELNRCERIGNQENRTEKNWLPFIYKGKVCFLYSTGPRLLIIDCNNNIIASSESEANCFDFRGGAAPIPFDGGWLWIIHQYAIRPQTTRRIYMHRFIWVDNFEKPKGLHISRPFCFQDQTIEFCSGMCHGNIGEILLTYGLLDNTAYIAVVPSNLIRTLIRGNKI
jgi:glycosyltransferase involved in cell wall biosynthesis